MLFLLKIAVNKHKWPHLNFSKLPEFCQLSFLSARFSHFKYDRIKETPCICVYISSYREPCQSPVTGKQLQAVCIEIYYVSVAV